MRTLEKGNSGQQTTTQTPTSNMLTKQVINVRMCLQFLDF